MECGSRYGISEYIEEIPQSMWETIALRPCNRV